MSEVKRYECNGSSSVFGCENGSLVDYGNYAAIEAKCSALAAENERLKYAVNQQIKLRAEIKNAGRPPHADFWVQSICEAEEKVKRALEESTATDAFLAEVRAQGVDMVRNAMIDFVDGEVGPNKNVPGLIRGAEICVSIAEQLRKGV